MIEIIALCEFSVVAVIAVVAYILKQKKACIEYDVVSGELFSVLRMQAMNI